MFKYELVYVGLNYAKFFNLCLKQDVILSNISTIDYKTISFFVNSKDYHKLTSLECFKSFDINIKTYGGVKHILNLLVSKVGFILGLVISLVIICYTSTLTCFITINNADNETKELIYNAIIDYGINRFQHNDINVDELELYILNQVPYVSMVSIKNNGASLIVNVNETEVDSSNKEYLPIIANYDMLITSIDVFSGTAKVKANDIVRQGDILIEPYVYNEYGEKVHIEPKAKICADVWFSDTYEYSLHENETTKTGKSKVIGFDVYFNNTKIYSKTHTHSFSDYIEIKIDNFVSKNMFLPIKIVKTIAYETKTSQITHDFNVDKDAIINSMKDNIMITIPKHISVNDTQIQISQNNDKYYIVVYLKCSIIIE